VSAAETAPDPLAKLEIDGEVMSHLIALMSMLGLERVFKGFLDSHRKPMRIVLIERHSPPSKWLKLALIDLMFLTAAVFKLPQIYLFSGDSYNRKAGQASILTAASRLLHRWKNLWNSVVL